MIVDFAGLTFELPPEWLDITHDLDAGSPATLARETGVGAIQFSVACYQRGAAPDIDRADLERMFRELCERQGIAAAPMLVSSARCLAVGGVSRSDDAIIGAWQLSDGKSVATVTYYAEGVHAQDAIREVADAETIVRTARFPGAPGA